MRNYLAAECYKVFRRKYLYLTLLVVLALEGLMLWGFWFTWSNGNTQMDFYSAVIMIPMMLSIGLYATILTGDMVFSEQYKHNTLKNEVSYGVSRVRIYLGKLVVATLVALLAAVVMVALYMAGCWVLLPHNELDPAGPPPQRRPRWCCAPGNNRPVPRPGLPATGGAHRRGCSPPVPDRSGPVPSILQLCGLLIHPTFEMIRQFMPAVMLEQLHLYAFQWDYVGRCWVVGLVVLAGSILVGLLAFRKKEIR